MHLSWSSSSVTSCSSLSRAHLMWLFHTCQHVLFNPRLRQRSWNKSCHHGAQHSPRLSKITVQKDGRGRRKRLIAAATLITNIIQPFHVQTWRVGQTDIYTLEFHSFDLYVLFCWDKEVVFMILPTVLATTIYHTLQSVSISISSHRK